MLRKEKRELFEQFSFLIKYIDFCLHYYLYTILIFFARKLFLLFASSKFENGTALETENAKL